MPGVKHAFTAGATVLRFPDLPAKLVQALEGAALVPAPEVLLRLMRAVEDEACSLEQIAAIVDKDPAISARILAAANSSAFHRGRALGTLEGCLQVLGLRVVRSIAVCLSVQCVFARQADNRVELSAFWHHSLLAAELARGLANLLGYARPGEAYLGGLLHDIGELALLSVLRDEYAQLLTAAVDENNLCTREFGCFGATHAEVGAWLVDQWRLDSTLADSVLFHHASPAQIAEGDLLARLVWSAHALAEAAPEAEAVVLEQVAVLLAQEGASVAEQLEQARSRVAQLAEAMGIAVKAPLHRSLPEAHYKAADVPDATGGLLQSMAETSLLQTVQRHAGAEAQAGSVLRAIAESLRILFGIEQSAFLRVEEGGHFLCGLSEQQGVLATIRLSMESSSSFAVRALREGRLLATQDGQSLVLADIQLSRALRSENLLFLPLLRAKQAQGVLLLGVSAAQQARLSTSGWLQSFARVALAGLEQHAASSAAHPAVQAVGRELQIRRFSHEVGNPLSIIKSYLRLLEHKVPTESGMHEELQVLREEIERVVRIVRQLGEPPAPVSGEVVAVNGVIDDLLRLYGESLFAARGITLETSLDPLGPQVQGDADGIKQILLNLLKNASEALPSGASVVVESSAAMLHEGNRYAGFAVRDTGPGIPLPVVQRLYAPPVAAGSDGRGMGLSIVGGLVRHMQGRVVCETRHGAGTRIGVLLPPAASEASATTKKDAGEI